MRRHYQWQEFTFFDGYGRRCSGTHLFLQPGNLHIATDMSDGLVVSNESLTSAIKSEGSVVTESPWAHVKQIKREVKWPKFKNAFFYKVYFKDNVKKLIKQDYPADAVVQPRSKILREEEDDEFTVNARFQLAWKLVEDLFVGKWDNDDGYSKYSSQFTGEVILFEERVECQKNESHNGFIIAIKAKDPTVHPALFRDKEGDDVMQNQYTLTARAICEGEYEELREDMFDCKHSSRDNNSEELIYFNVVNSVKA